MNNFTVEYQRQNGYLEVRAIGVWLSEDDVLNYTFQIVEKAQEENLKLLLLDQDLLYMSLMDEQIERYMEQLENQLSESFDFHFISILSSDGGREQRFFQGLSETKGFKFEVYSGREEALKRIEELK